MGWKIHFCLCWWRVFVFSVFCFLVSGIICFFFQKLEEKKRKERGRGTGGGAKHLGTCDKGTLPFASFTFSGHEAIILFLENIFHNNMAPFGSGYTKDR